MVDAIDSKSVIRKGVRVQVPSPVNEAGQVKACPALRLHGFFVVGFSKKMENSTIIVEIKEKNCKSDDGHSGGEGKSRLRFSKAGAVGRKSRLLNNEIPCYTDQNQV